VDGYAVHAVMVGSQIIRQEISTPRQANNISARYAPLLAPAA
jgi:hypothetical protein